MKSALQQYEANNRHLMWISLALVAAGVFLYAMLSGIGVLIVAIGLAGLVWCFLHR